MFADARRVPRGTALECDVCIIGAGPAGISLARELIGSPLRVALLESGGLSFDRRTQALYEGRTAGLPYFALDTARLRFFGGSTNHWEGLARPFDEIDFEQRDDVPLSGWPITRADLEPYYARAAQVAHLPASSLSLASVRERDAFAPLPVNGDRLETRFAQQVPSAYKSFGDSYADEIRRATNVVAYLHANVMEIETNDAARTATSVRVATLSGNRFRVQAGTFVVAAGGIENARLLLASRRRRPRGLGNDHDLVGRYFLEHPRWVAGKLLPADRHLRTGFYRVHRVGRTAIKGYVALADHVRRAEGLRDVQISIHPNPAPSFARASVSEDAGSARALLGRGRSAGLGRDLINVAGDLMTWQTFTVPGAPLPLPYPEVARELIGSAPARREELVPTLAGDLAGLGFKKAGRAPVASLDLSTRVEPLPNPDSRVTLIAERDALGMNRVKLDWRLSRQDRHAATRALAARRRDRYSPPRTGADRGRRERAGLASRPRGRLASHGYDADEPGPASGCRRRELPSPRDVEPVHRGELRVPQRGRGDADVDLGHPGAAAGRSPRAGDAMSAPRRSRREFVLAAAGLGAGLLFGSLRPWRTLVQVEGPGTPALRLSRLIEHRQSARAVGLEYLRDAPPGTTAATLAHLVAAGVPGRLAGSRVATDHELRRLLAGRIRQDFDEECVVAVDGWVASLTEARLCAIVALVGV